MAAIFWAFYEFKLTITIYNQTIISLESCSIYYDRV